MQIQTVQDLIDALKKCPPDSKVVFEDDVNKVHKVNEVDDLSSQKHRVVLK